MLRLRRPELISDETVLVLLQESLPPKMSIGDCEDHDFKAREERQRNGDYLGILIHRIVAARGYNSLGRKRNAAYSYDHATRVALSRGMAGTSLVCAERSVVLYESMLRTVNAFPEIERLKRELNNWAKGRVDKAKELVAKTYNGDIPLVPQNGHRWFC